MAPETWQICEARKNGECSYLLIVTWINAGCRALTFRYAEDRTIDARERSEIPLKRRTGVTRMLTKISVAAAFGAALLITALATAGPHRSGNVHRNVHVNGNVHVNKNVPVNRDVHVNRHINGNTLVVGRRYHGGVWYGTGRRYWHGQWWNYGVGDCWLSTPIGYVWTCG
jgi:hypothetical protein